MSLRDQLDPDFLQEMDELLQEMESSVLKVECNAGDQDAINQLFRVMHSIKGTAGMFALDAVTDFTHHLESELDTVRKTKSSVQRPLVDAILKSRDLIPLMLEGVNCSSEVKAALDALNGKVTIVSPPPAAEPAEKLEQKTEKSCFTIDFTALPNFFEGGNQLLKDLREAGNCSVQLQFDRIPSPLDSAFDPRQCSLSWKFRIETALTEDELADLFIFYVGSSDQLRITRESSCSAEVPNRLGDILVERGVISPEHVEKALDMQKSIGEILVAQGIVSQSDVRSALSEQNQRRASGGKSSESKSTIRVEALKLDRLVDLVGEMVTAQARLMSVARTSSDPALQEVSEIIETLTVGLRDQTMSIRMVPLSTILGGFNRLVRDLSSDLGKEILFETEGEDTELDKSVVERLKEPLMHIIRNSADHGIESRDERTAGGKPVQGKIKISAYHEGAQVVISVSDDGGGINLEAVRTRAAERGLISPDAVLSSAEIAQLVCMPGFSTAEKISDISGRGVGMDVVKQSIESLRGTLIIDTVPGNSTTISLRLPVTLAIIDGLMVSLDDDSFIIPLIAVEECVDLNHQEVDKIRGRDILNLRGEAVPFIRLRQRLGRSSQAPDREQVVITMIDGRRTGVVVDSVIGSHQTVLKPLGAAFKKAKEFSGATILGDGSVALILDVQTMIN